MFVDEAKITSQLSHANLAQTFDLGRIDDTYYIAMEYVPGRDLRAVFERMKRRGERMPLPLCAYVMARVCEGLDYAHRKRDPSGRDLHIVHRDVSPQNIILSYEGEVKLIDFGIAKAANKITKTQAGILKGKFGYMSPEQVRGLPLDRRSDIFAAGVVLYELATGERLFTGNSDFSVLEKVQQAKVTPPSQVDARISAKLERVMLKALAREPEDRYQFAADFAADLTRFLLETQPKNVTRDEVAGFMKLSFPEDEARDDRPARRPPPQLDRKPPPRLESPARSKPPPRAEPSRPPPLPRSLTAGLAPGKILGEDDPDRTQKGVMPNEPRAEIIVRSKIDPPPLPELPLSADAPTRPMSMDELARAEREYVKLQKEDTSPSATSPSVVLGEYPTPPLRRRPPPLPQTLLEGLPRAEKRNGSPPLEEPEPEVARLEDQKTHVRPAPPKPAPHMGRMQVNKPTLVGEDPLPPGESTRSTVTRQARLRRRVQYGIVIAAALGIAAWALFTTPRPRGRGSAAAGPATGSLAVKLDPADSQLLLDGAQVKDSAGPQWSEPRLSAGNEHVLTARHDGYAEQSVPVALARGEQRKLSITLIRLTGELVVLSAPSGAQVYVDGVRRGVTPAYLPDIDSAKSHAVTVEKRCYRSWQVAVPARTGRRELAASLLAAVGACPGRALEKTETMAPPRDLPDETAARATLGYLSLGSRPSANVLIDGVDIGQRTPLLSWPLRKGSHRIRLVVPGRIKDVAVEIRTGETHSEIVDLQPAAQKRGRR
ncbi:MAG TPA: serine/threonine-protein kinase [Myxococcales bacterium]